MSTDRRQVNTHVGIDRRTGTAAGSIFYTLEALTPSDGEVDLYGKLYADVRARDRLAELLLKEDCRISVGHGRTRGYGDLHLQVADDSSSDDPAFQPTPGTQAKRWQAWSRALVDFLQRQDLDMPDLDADAFYFSLTFPNGAVLLDRYLCYSTDPADMVPWLPEMPRPEDAFPVAERAVREFGSTGNIRWIAAVTRPERLRGWNAAHGLPRQDEWAVARGATYVYCYTGDDRDRELLLTRLFSLTSDGIGLRRNEGFGVTWISNAFHLEFGRGANCATA